MVGCKWVFEVTGEAVIAGILRRAAIANGSTGEDLSASLLMADYNAELWLRPRRVVKRQRRSLKYLSSSSI